MNDECKKYEDLLDFYAAGELSKKMATEVEEHIFRCGECREKVKVARLVQSALTPKIEQTPPGFARSIALKISDIAQTHRMPLYSKIDAIWLLPWAAFILFAFHFIPKIFNIPLPSVMALLLKASSSPLFIVVSSILVLGLSISAISITAFGFAAKR